MSFMHDGGMAMWMTLAFFIAAIGVAIVRRHKDGWRIALAGAAATIGSGLAGFSTGIYATVGHLRELEAVERAEILGVGLRESVNNTLLAGVLAFLLALVAVGLARTNGMAKTA